MRLILSIVFAKIIERNFSCVKLPGWNSGFLIMQSVYLVKFKQLTALRRHSMWNRPNKGDSPQKWAQLDTVLNWGLESPQNPQAGRRRAGAALWRAAKAERPALRELLSKPRVDSSSPREERVGRGLRRGEFPIKRSEERRVGKKCR